MNMMDKFLNIMKLNDGDEDEGYYDEDDYLDEEDTKDEKILPMKSDPVEEPKNTGSNAHHI